MNAADALGELAGLGVWVTWRYETRQGSDKPTKMPYAAHTDLKASSIDPSTWSTRDIAEHAARRDNRDGIGIVLAPLGEGRHLGGVDLDACIDDNGNLALWAREIIELMRSYAEVSPSGRGLKVFFLYDPRETQAEGMRWRSNVRIKGQTNGSDKEPGIEFYLRARYFTVTHQTFESFDTVRLVDLATLHKVQAKMSAFADKPKAPTHHPRRYDDDEHGLVLDALSSIPGEDAYAEWARIGMALHAAVQGSDEGYRGFVAWSAKSSKFDARHCEQKWREWDRKPANRLTSGTIIHIARQNGWQNPRQAKSNGVTSSLATGEDANAPSTEWPDIDPGLTESARRDIPVFPDHLFPPKWRKWTVATAEGAGAPIDYVAAGLMADVAGMTGCGAFVEVTSSWREPLVLWQGNVGAPSMGKSPALAATRRLIDAVESDARAKDAERQREHETKIEAAKLAEEKWREQVAEAAEAGKPPPTKPASADHIDPFVPTQFVIEDATIESIVDVARGNPRGLILCRDELTGWLQNLARYNGGNDRPFWLERWSAGGATVNRKNRPAVRLARLGVSIVGGIQPDRLGEICGDDDDGMASRFLFALPERPPYKPLKGRQAGDDARAIERLQRISTLASNAEPLVMKLDAGAVKIFDEFHAEHHADASGYEGMEAGWFGKGPGHVVRLAGVLTLLAWSETGSAGPPSAITADTVRDAAGLWSGYYLPIARAVFAITGKTQAERQARRIITWIRRTKASAISVEDIRVQALGRTVDAADATALIARLVKGNVLRPAAPAAARGPGKPTVRWDVNPALHAPKPEDAYA